MHAKDIENRPFPLLDSTPTKVIVRVKILQIAIFQQSVLHFTQASFNLAPRKHAVVLPRGTTRIHEETELWVLLRDHTIPGVVI